MIYDFGLRLETDNDVVIFFFFIFFLFFVLFGVPFVVVVCCCCLLCLPSSLSFNIFFVPFDLRSSFFFEDFY